MRCPSCQTENRAGTRFCVECGLRLPATAAASPASPGTTGTLPRQTVLQDRYVITEKLGQGGMGAVYRASDRRLSTVTWAVKEMSLSAITGPLERQRAREAFRREAEMLAALAHPNLPRVTDHFEQDGKAYLVMEYVPGETLLSFLQREGLPQPLPRVLAWARQLCDVLDYLHTQQPPIIFRDLKPANIMLTPQGQVKLIDFGIARVFKPGQARDTQAFGTVGYSAPEQYGHGQTDARSDVYALGVLLHQLLTGHDPTITPFRLPSATQINPNVPAYISAALATATTTDPDRRFPSIRAFRDALFSAAGQVMIRTDAQPIGHGAAGGGAIYARLDAQPYSQPGSQPYGPGAPPATTGLANASRWIGIASVGVMGVATLLILMSGGDLHEPLGSVSMFLSIPSFGGMLVAMMLGPGAGTPADRPDEQRAAPCDRRDRRRECRAGAVLRDRRADRQHGVNSSSMMGVDPCRIP